MVDWLSQNLPSVLATVVLFAIAFFAIRSKVKARRDGSCGCGCTGCNGCAKNQNGGAK